MFTIAGGARARRRAVSIERRAVASVTRRDAANTATRLIPTVSPHIRTSELHFLNYIEFFYTQYGNDMNAFSNIGCRLIFTDIGGIKYINSCIVNSSFVLTNHIISCKFEKLITICKSLIQNKLFLYILFILNSRQPCYDECTSYVLKKYLKFHFGKGNTEINISQRKH